MVLRLTPLAHCGATRAQLRMQAKAPPINVEPPASGDRCGDELPTTTVGLNVRPGFATPAALVPEWARIGKLGEMNPFRQVGRNAKKGVQRSAL
jgi:hypothetical protein